MSRAAQDTATTTDTMGDPADGAFQRLVLFRRLSVFSKEALQSILPSSAAVLTLLYTFWGQTSSIVLGGWALVVLFELIVFTLVVQRFDLQATSMDALRAQWTRLMSLTVISSTSWAFIFVYTAQFAQGQQVALLALIGVGVLAGVLLVHRATYRAALYHIAVVSAALIYSALRLGEDGGIPAALLLVTFALGLASAVRGFEQAFIESAQSEIALRESSSTVRMLLNDYEEQSSDWLWTVGPRGNLRDVTDRFAAALGLSSDELEGQSLLGLVASGEDRDLLAAHLEDRRPFRDLLVRLRIADKLHYWRVSGRPRSDGRLSGVARDVTTDKLVEDRVAFMAHYDNLTGLANRYLFNERLREVGVESCSRDCNVALFYLDLDDFKAVNDTRGHLVGDRLLREVGTRLEQEVRGTDLVARLGGDEFAVLLETRAGDGLLMERAHRFLSVVREPYEIDGHTYRISTSVGIAQCLEGACDAEELMRRADLALYAAKAKGRDNVAMFDPSLDQAARLRRSTEADLRDALPRGQMRMYYQAMIDLTSGATTGFEALLRWEHPTRGLVVPTEFLAVAEETGMIQSVGEWVIRQSLADAAAMPDHMRIAINLSPTQVKSRTLVATMAQAIHSSGIAPGRIELEITEHVLMDEWELSRATLLRLRDLGVRIALDDFGTGYSSLGYLRRFAFDRIKIDRTFIEDIAGDVGSQAIVSSITRLAEALGMDTTAEGIEDRAQLDLLRKLGVDEAQGYLIARPVPIEDVVADEKLPSGSDRMEGSLLPEFLDYRQARTRRTG